MAIVTLHVDKMVYGGCGLARTDTGAVLVRDAIAGETVMAESVGRQGGMPVFQAREIIQASDARRIPFCLYAATCGGCDWQHISYDAQVQFKLSIVHDCLRRIGKFTELPEFELFHANEKAYRWRVQLALNKAQNRLGFFARHSNEIISIDSCPLLIEPLNRFLSNKNQIIKQISGRIDQIKAIADVAENCASDPSIKPFSSNEIDLTVGRHRFAVSGKSFFQANALLCESLANWAQTSIEGDVGVDLYGGVGLFAVTLGHRFKQGVVVESDTDQARLAARNLTANTISSWTTINTTAETFLQQHREHAIDCLIVDPPRTGLSPIVTTAILQKPPARLLYVSCNPSTLARDLRLLTNDKTYTVKRAALFDMYPQTYHVECAVLLEKSIEKI